ncbi:hypothetical protein DPEC_G00049300 [Dallia pectoralis]|uniref:Uncharacterized protein n=1 Tax=Dallia pectoralis TaxID=75939 RepID=A0ACC2HAX3_DALPE|nr:hypothetical protein DPEC_G00049300 [Dallia pectoralis]
MEAAEGSKGDHISSFCQANPMYDMDQNLIRSDLFSLQCSDVKPAKAKTTNRCLNFVIVYLIFQTLLNAFLLYKAFSKESRNLSSRFTTEKQISDNNIPQLIDRNNSLETTSIRLQSLQAQVNNLCGEDGQLGRLKADLVVINTSNTLLQERVKAISLLEAPRGTQGLPGPPGMRGEAGARGDKGDTGQKGDPGVDGQHGGKGEPGEPGEPGSKGENGVPGRSNSVTGPPGLPGLQGLKGDRGPDGVTGIPGLNGVKGDTGAQGQRGETGSPGLKGDRGIPGPVGPQGNKGDPGPLGTGVTKPVNVRISGGVARGRVEVLWLDQWGTVCDDSFDVLDGTVICKSLGYQRATSVFTGIPGTGKIWLDDLGCTGTEKSIFDCKHSGLGINNCQHAEDASVQCV